MRRSISILIMIIPIILSACQGDRSASESRPPVVEEPTQESISATDSQEEPPVASATAPVIESLVPTPREGLEATDPSTVVLASSKPTLVEFFAFW